MSDPVVNVVVTTLLFRSCNHRSLYILKKGARSWVDVEGEAINLCYGNDQTCLNAPLHGLTSQSPVLWLRNIIFVNIVPPLQRGKVQRALGASPFQPQEAEYNLTLIRFPLSSALRIITTFACMINVTSRTCDRCK